MNPTAGQIYTLIPKVMASIGAVGKDRQNKDQNYRFRGLEDIYNAVHPALVANGVFCVPQVLTHESQDRVSKNGSPMIRVVMKIAHRFYAPDGSSVEVTTCGEGIDNSDKATNKAMSFAMKYAYVELLAWPYADVEDGDIASPDVGARKNDVPRIEEDIPLLASGVILAPAEDRITTEQAGKWAERFRKALPEDMRSKSDSILHDWLGQKLYVDEHGNPSKLAVLKSDYERIGKESISFAKSFNPKLEEAPF